ncbi:MAG: helix-turn-helix domain-containing protein [Enterococcus sp.]
MKPILILTKNLVLEQELQKQLQYLNYEVFSSVELLEGLKASRRQTDTQNDTLQRYLLNYQAIILSETIADSEIRELLPILKSEKWGLLRKLGNKPNTNEEEQLKSLGVIDWLFTDQSIDFLREQLSEKLTPYQKDETNIVFLYKNDSIQETGNLVQLKRSLTKREQTTLDCLIRSKGGVVSREDLCSHLWNERPNNSHLSQTSVLIKRIKMKLEIAGFDPEMIKTIWGSGYTLKKGVFEKDFLVKI